MKVILRRGNALFAFLALTSILTLPGCGGKDSSKRPNNISSNQVDRIIDTIGQKLEHEAFAFGIDFSDATQYLRSNATLFKQQMYDEKRLIAYINTALKAKYDISHLGIFPASMLKDLIEDSGDSSSVQISGLPFPFKEYGRAHKRNAKPKLEWAQANGQSVPVLVVPTFCGKGYKRDTINTLIQNLVNLGHTSLILDLQGNTGGLSVNNQHLISCFLPDGTTFGYNVNKSIFSSYSNINMHSLNYSRLISHLSAHGNHRSLKIITGGTNVKFNGKVAVLIDDESASSSEIVASALKELHPNVRVFGQSTAGAVLTSLATEIPHSPFAVMYPIAEYITAQHRRLEGDANRTTPHVFAPTSADARRQAALYCIQ